MRHNEVTHGKQLAQVAHSGCYGKRSEGRNSSCGDGPGGSAAAPPRVSCRCKHPQEEETFLLQGPQPSQPDARASWWTLCKPWGLPASGEASGWGSSLAS